MPEPVERLFQAHRVRDCVLRAARGADRMDAELIRSAFWPDATIRYGVGAAWSTAELLGAWFPVASACVSTQHHLFNHRLDVDGDTAHAESYYIAVFAPEADVSDGSLLPFSGSVRASEVAFQGGRCVDRLEQRGGEWRIASRQVVGDWFATAERANGGGPLRNRRDPSDRRDASPGAVEHVEELLATDAIRDCVFRYARAIDRLDSDLLASALVGLDDERELIDSLRDQATTRPTQSTYISNLRVELDGASAAAEAYFLSAQRDTGTRVDLVGGRHVFQLTAASGEWRIAGRTTVGEWHAVGDGAHIDAFLQATGNKSKRNRDDASYDPLVTDGVSRTVADLIAREGVRDCLARYARGVDRLDREIIESAHVDVAPQFVDYMFRQADVRPIQNHYWTNLRIQLAGDDAAFIEAYYVSVHGYVDGASTGFIEGTTSKDDIKFIGGRYVRWFDRVGDRWGLRNLSASKQYPPPSGGLGDWHAMLNGSGMPAYLQATGNGAQRRGSRDDPSYAGAAHPR